MKFLLSLPGIVATTVDNKGVNAVLHAATCGDVDMVKQILGLEGVDARDADDTGRTALIQAAFKADVAIMEELLEARKVAARCQSTCLPPLCHW